MPRDFTHADPAAGSRAVIERELARQALKSANTGAETDFKLTRDDIRAAIRDADDDLIAKIIEAGATLQEFSQALYWMSNSEATRNAGKRSPANETDKMSGFVRSAGFAISFATSLHRPSDPRARARVGVSEFPGIQTQPDTNFC